MESATIISSPSNSFSSILLSVRTKYSQRTRIWKNISTQYRCTVWSCTNSTQKQRQLLRPLNTGSDPLENHKATKPAFNVGPTSASQQNSFKSAFRWRAEDDALLVVIGSSLPSSTKSKKIVWFAHVLPAGICDAIHFNSSDMGYCVQYFVYFQGYWTFRKINKLIMGILACLLQGIYDIWYHYTSFIY